MKTALSVIAVAAALTLAPVVGGSFAAADDSAQQAQQARFSPEDRAAFLDARIAALKAGLQLNADQEKNWAPLELAMRDLAKERATRLAAWRDRREAGDNEADEVNPIDRLSRTSEFLSARAADLKKLAARRQAALRQPGRRPEAPIRRAFPWVHGPRPVAQLASRGLTIRRLSSLFACAGAVARGFGDRANAWTRPVAERGHLCHDLGLDGSPEDESHG